ncbi:uncharacterized protein LOC114543322 [Dendronephthya gigantea]|uniref:uncharacterized protein LOC114543322 n=1 Tax=Dendronephthya gigantea TaxID=151771 RepID=UPI00106D3920|nr:uncharacterized protein LOC114543322 [Dendronephthya gigantea]
MARWCSLGGVIDKAGTDLRPGVIDYILEQSIEVNDNRVKCILAAVRWFSVHPQRHKLGSPTEVWCRNVWELDGCASFIPVQRIFSWKTSKRKRRQYKQNRRERLNKKKKYVFIEVNKDDKKHEERDEIEAAQLGNDVAIGNKTSAKEMDRNVAKDWLYMNMIKYFKKKNGFLKFRRAMEKPKEGEYCSGE